MCLSVWKSGLLLGALLVLSASTPTATAVYRVSARRQLLLVAAQLSSAIVQRVGMVLVAVHCLVKQSVLLDFRQMVMS